MLQAVTTPGSITADWIDIEALYSWHELTTWPSLDMDES
jgi:hypothetical protein